MLNITLSISLFLIDIEGKNPKLCGIKVNVNVMFTKICSKIPKCCYKLCVATCKLTPNHGLSMI